MTYSEISSSVQNERIAKGLKPETQLTMVPQCATVALLSEAPSSIGHTGALAKLWNWPVFIWLRAVLVIIL